jgi:GST-like protein
MIEFYSHGSPNGHKVSIALEELEIPYETRGVNVFAGEGQSTEFLSLNPAGKIPVIRDTESGAVVTESNAILLYLADKAKRLVPGAGLERIRAIELLFLQASLHGPMFGQRSHFGMFGPEVVPYAIRRYEEQGEIFDKLADTLLSGRSYFLGASYSIVDIAFYGWYFAANKSGYGFSSKANLSGWFKRVSDRPAVQRGITIPTALPDLPPLRRA